MLGLVVRAVFWLAGVIVWVFQFLTPGGQKVNYYWWVWFLLTALYYLLTLQYYMAVCSKFGGMLGSAMRSWTNYVLRAEPIWLGHIDCSLHYVSRGGVEVGSVYQLQCYCRPLPVCVLAMDACSSASAIPHVLWTNGMLHDWLWVGQGGSGLSFPSSQTFPSIDVWKYNLYSSGP